jgi:ribonucleoside-triphosphate reductase
MCCRLRLDTTELRKRGGGLFGSNPMTGSIGVFTINLPRIGYLSKSEGEFRARLWRMMHLGKTSLEIKRKIIEDQTDKGLYPYSAHYLRDVKARTGRYWYNHFNTIGIIGMNEALLNFMGKDITSPEGQAFANNMMEYMRGVLKEIQEETGNFYNLEATPAEGTSYRLAMLDRKKYPDIHTAGTEEAPYYTNSTQLPVGFTDDIFETLDLQDALQCGYTGGTVLHLYIGERIYDAEVCKNLIRKIFMNYKLPYISITPTFSICNTHGYIAGEHFACPECGAETEVWSRVTGYLRPVQNYNRGKKQEYHDRRKFKINAGALV